MIFITHFYVFGDKYKKLIFCLHFTHKVLAVISDPVTLFHSHFLPPRVGYSLLLLHFAPFIANVSFLTRKKVKMVNFWLIVRVCELTINH